MVQQSHQLVRQARQRLPRQLLLQQQRHLRRLLRSVEIIKSMTPVQHQFLASQLALTLLQHAQNQLMAVSLDVNALMECC